VKIPLENRERAIFEVPARAEGVMNRHKFSLGLNHEICEQCLATVKQNDGVSGECPGDELDLRDRMLVNAALERGTGIGLGLASRVVSKLYDGQRGDVVVARQIYKALQEIGDLGKPLEE
jgi:hypothetical protein